MRNLGLSWPILAILSGGVSKLTNISYDFGIIHFKMPNAKMQGKASEKQSNNKLVTLVACNSAIVANSLESNAISNA